MSAASETAALLRRRIAQVSELAPGSIGDMLHFELLDCDPEAGDYFLSCRTETWMRNPAGTLHGGLGATVLDQAMGLIPYCLKTEAGIAPTVQPVSYTHLDVYKRQVPSCSQVALLSETYACPAKLWFRAGISSVLVWEELLQV